MKTKIYLLMAMLLSFAGPGHARSAADEAALEMQKGNYAIAYCVWKQMADKGDANAHFNLGWMFHNGYGLAIDDTRAMQEWQLAAAQQHGEALLSLGNLYRLGGQGIKRDRTKAFEYFIQAAKVNVEDAAPLARVMLGQLGEESAPYRTRMLQKHADELGGQILVKGSRSNFRSRADSRSKVLRMLYADNVLIELGRNGQWVQAATTDDALVGWIHSSLVKSSGK